MKWWIGGLLAVITIAGCQEELTAPADCPALCPGGQPEVFDEVFPAVTGADSSYVGYVQPYQAPAMLVSNGLQGFEDRGLVRFLARASTVTVRDTARTYTIDSVALSFSVVARDTNQTGLQLELYRLPPSFDSSATFGSVAPAFVPENLVATVDVADTLNAGVVRTVLQGADLSRVEIPAADSGRLALGIRIDSPVPTGIRVGALASGSGPIFTTYATLDVPDTGTARLRTIPLGPALTTYVEEVPPVIDTTLLTVGGSVSSRALLRFSLPSRIRDSATIIRATLELTPVAPITGLPTDPGILLSRPVLADVGAKSPVNPTVGLTGLLAPPADTLEVGTTTVSLEAVRLVELWLGRTTRPSALMLSLTPEAASFTRPVFYSTRAADPALRPQLRISYLLSFPFETP
ncbi:MAG TPA: hypothetical protein VNO19_10320 [Gemmatimonadales bacterium]|nr:hypothetical protein [Gemmatimonadales bacterium]